MPIVIGVTTMTTSVVAGVISICTGLLVGALIAALTIPCEYTLTDDTLKIRSGLLEDDVPLRSIRRAEKSGSLWSAPALSLRRVKISTDRGMRLVSPRDRDAFIADLEARVRKVQAG